MTKTPKCKECNYCKSMGRSQSQRNRIGGRHYYCGYSDSAKLDPRMTGFISIGDATIDSPIKIKTSPRWCPLRGGK